MLRWKSSLKPAAAAPSDDITLENSAVTTATSFSSPLDISVNIPAVSINDILLLLVATDGNSDPTDSPPSGWTKITEQQGHASWASSTAAYWKRASSGSIATTESWSPFFANGETYYIWVGAYSGCVTSGSPVDAYNSAVTGYGSPWSVSLTTTVSDTMVVTISGSTQGSLTQTWSDGTELIDTAYPGTSATVSINEKLEATSGSKTRTATPSSTTNNSMIAVALKPAGGTSYATDGMTLDNTWTSSSTNYTDLQNATSASAKVTCNFDKDDTGIIMEAGGAGDGIILYIYNETLYFQCGEGGSAGGDSDTGEVSYTITDTSARDFIIEWSADTSGCALYVDGTLIGTDAFSNDYLAGVNQGTIGAVSVSNVAVNRGSFGNSNTFSGSVTSAEIFVGEVTSDVSGL